MHPLTPEQKALGICKISGSGRPLIFLNGGPAMSAEYLFPGFDFLDPYRTRLYYDQSRSGNLQDVITQLESITKLFPEGYGLFAHSWGFALLMLFLTRTTPTPTPHEVIIANPVSLTSQQFTKDKEKLFAQFSAPDAAKVKDLLKDPTKSQECLSLLFKYYTYKKEELPIKFGPYDDALRNHLVEQMTPYDFTNDLAKLPPHTLWITAEADPFSLPSSVHAHTIPKAGHFPYLENPPAFEKVVLGWIQ